MSDTYCHQDSHRWEYRIHGQVVVRSCPDCGRVQVAETDDPPVYLWSRVGRLGTSDYRFEEVIK